MISIELWASEFSQYSITSSETIFVKFVMNENPDDIL